MSGIVLIEDDPLLQSLVAEWLTAEGYRVLGNGAGLTGGAPEVSRPELLIVDVFMPRSSGIEHLRWARSVYPGAPIIAMSGQFRPGVGAAGAAAEMIGVDRVVAKPIEREVMLDAVRSLIGRRH